MKRRILILTALILGGAATVFVLTGSSATPLQNKYRRMGTIAAVAERCLHSARLHETVTASLKSGAGDTMFGGSVIAEGPLKPLLQSYTDGYKSASADLRLWDETRGKPEPAPQTCSDLTQMQRIRTFEAETVAEIEREEEIFRKLLE